MLWGVGYFNATVDLSTSKISFVLSVGDLTDVIAAHLHAYTDGKLGSIVVSVILSDACAHLLQDTLFLIILSSFWTVKPPLVEKLAIIAER